MTVTSKTATKKRAAQRAAVRKSASPKPSAKKPSAKKPTAIRTPSATREAIQSGSALAAVIGDNSLSRAEVIKKIAAYFKNNDLQAGENKRVILPATVEPQYLTRAQIQSMVKSVRKP